MNMTNRIKRSQMKTESIILLRIAISFNQRIQNFHSNFSHIEQYFTIMHFQSCLNMFFCTYQYMLPRSCFIDVVEYEKLLVFIYDSILARLVGMFTSSQYLAKFTKLLIHTSWLKNKFRIMNNE